MIQLRFRVLYKHLTGIERADKILSRNLRSGMEAVGKRLRAAAERRMRSDIGESRKSLTIKVTTRGLNNSVIVFSTLIQAFIDAYGLKPGTFPPFLRGSRLYRWTARRFKAREFASGVSGKGKRKVSHLSRRPVASRKAARIVKRNAFREVRRSDGKQVFRVGREPARKTARLTARENSIQRASFLAARSIFEKGIKASHWNREALDANKTIIETDIRNALARGVNEINRT